MFIARHLQKSYGIRSVIKDVSLNVKPGEVVGLLGPNGAGKTTFFYMLAGLVKCDKGQILLDGVDITKSAIHHRKGISYLPQEASIFRKLTAKENILAALELTTEKSQREARLQELLQSLQIEHIQNQPALALSGGERRRVEIARALAMQPKYILLDEPFAGVDPIAVIDIQKVIELLKTQGIGVLITDHNVRETLTICDHAYIVSEGVILAKGKPQEIIQNEDVRRVYLGKDFQM